MRKLLEVVSLIALICLAWITYDALYGPQAIGGRVPTHFDLLGNPNAWGPPRTLLLLPMVAFGMYVIITVVSQFPTIFNYPVHVNPENRQRLQNLALDMIAWLKAETLCLFAVIQYEILEGVERQHNNLPPALMFVALAAVLVTMTAYIAAMRRAG